MKEAVQEPAEEKSDGRKSLEYATLRVIIAAARREHELKVMIIRYTVGSFYKCTDVYNIKCPAVCIASCAHLCGHE